MANKREKKIQKKVEGYTQLTTYFIGGINVFYILSLIYSFTSGDGVGFWDIIIFLWFSFVTYTTHNAVLGAMTNDYGYSYYQDIFIINLFVQFLAIFSRKSLYLYLLIPAYLVYAFGGYIWAYIVGPGEAEPEEQLSDKERRKLEKKRIKQERTKVKYVK
ncbi:unnamed protein product [Moneuplotes crassus]|uniref:Uncharacterized protein n=1 Tax=Euplotes crassus TaxID=5936 RepID=A0AAD2D697_EUPCR|nr:unnamed protein product [Moneuplotes crassus]